MVTYCSSSLYSWLIIHCITFFPYPSLHIINRIAKINLQFTKIKDTMFLLSKKLSINKSEITPPINHKLRASASHKLHRRGAATTRKYTWPSEALPACRNFLARSGIKVRPSLHLRGKGPHRWADIRSSVHALLAQITRGAYTLQARRKPACELHFRAHVPRRQHLSRARFRNIITFSWRRIGGESARIAPSRVHTPGVVRSLSLLAHRG